MFDLLSLALFLDTQRPRKKSKKETKSSESSPENPPTSVLVPGGAGSSQVPFAGSAAPAVRPSRRPRMSDGKAQAAEGIDRVQFSSSIDPNGFSSLPNMTDRQRAALVDSLIQALSARNALPSDDNKENREVLEDYILNEGRLSWVEKNGLQISKLYRPLLFESSEKLVA